MDKCNLSCFIHFYGRTMFWGIEHLPKILTSKMSKYISSDFPHFFSEAYRHPIHPYQVVCRVLYWCRSYECFNLKFFGRFSKKIQKCWPILKWLGISPPIFPEGAYDNPIHPYQIVRRVLYWFRSYEFNSIFWLIQKILTYNIEMARYIDSLFFPYFIR